MTREEFKRQYGYDPLDTQATVRALNEKQGTGAQPTSTKPKNQPFFPGAEIGKSWVQAGSNIKNLVTGGKKGFMEGLNQGNRVNVPALAGDYLQAGALLGGGAVPIAKAKPAFEAVRYARGTGTVTKGAKAAAVAKNVGAEAGLGYAGFDVGSGLKEGEGFGAFKPGMGTVLGAAGGGAISALSRTSQRLGDIPEELGGAMSARGDKKADSKLLELIMSEGSRSKTISAFKQAGQEGGMMERGLLKSVKIKPTAKDRERMDAVRDLVDPKKSAVENNTRLNNEIARVSRDELEPFLKANPRAFNVQTINSVLKKMDMPDLFKSDQTLKNNYNLVRQRMISAIERNPKTMEGLWEARKQFDREVADQFGDAAFNSDSKNAVRRAIRDMRNEVNDFMAREIGGNDFKQYMRRLSNIYSVRDNIAEKAVKQLGTNRFSRAWNRLSNTQKTIVLTGAGYFAADKILFGGSENAAASAMPSITPYP